MRTADGRKRVRTTAHPFMVIAFAREEPVEREGDIVFILDDEDAGDRQSSMSKRVGHCGLGRTAC